MTSEGDDFSWDTEREGAPERPVIPTNLTDEPLMPRPRRVFVAFWFVLAGGAIFIALTVIAALRLEEILGTLTEAIPDDLTEDYTEDDIERATYVMLAAASALSLLLFLFQLLAASTVLRRRSAGARVFYVVVTLVHIPVTIVSPILRDGHTSDLVLSGIGAACYLIAAVLLCTRRVSTWLRQEEQAMPVPLTEFQTRDAEVIR